MSGDGIIEVGLGERAYSIHVGAGLLDDGASWRPSLRGPRALVVTNETIAPLYLDRVRARLDGITHAALVLPDGEAYKTLESCARVFDALAMLGAGRDACVLALGGGVIGDLAGFAAASWMRGIDFVQMPTTLLAMVDSSVGGKTGVNLPAGKNLVGAFHQPRAVVADTTTLATLPDREYRAGLAEVVKYGAIGNEAFFEWIEANADALASRDEAAVVHAVTTSCRHKAAIVARDEHERGERALLNFGHTFGHALETEGAYTTLLHGEAVAIGMVLAARLSGRILDAPASDTERLVRVLAALGLPVEPPASDPQRLLGHMRMDKKNLGGRLRLILWRGIGKATIAEGVEDATVLAHLDRHVPRDT